MHTDTFTLVSSPRWETGLQWTLMTFSICKLEEIVPPSTFVVLLCIHIHSVYDKGHLSLPAQNAASIHGNIAEFMHTKRATKRQLHILKYNNTVIRGADHQDTY